ncbi:uncharacterized protein LOC123523510 [Mercenaria mercenaria]|uniref:uncharacterized protein LOC123523510 n=1 Tax=Mercenaria mercenaria TaxID=6596 RepID=UPI00234EEE9E|nr:uncharacterized protein LOC123523510 [Mercenaria mercenaria]XP_045157112.2 uncharacterized protein LOC123523510 [Mercenaria mercenaria]
MASVEAFIFLPLCMSFSGALQLAGFVSPGWIRFKNRFHTIHTGIWYTLTCTETCETSSVYKDHEAGSYHPYRPWQIQTTIALLACVIAVICLIKTRNTTGAIMVKWLTNGAYCSLLSGILSLVPAGTVADIVRTGEHGEDDMLFPYSLLLTGLGGILALVISLISLYSVQSGQTTNEPGVHLSSM